MGGSGCPARGLAWADRPREVAAMLPRAARLDRGSSPSPAPLRARDEGLACVSRFLRPPPGLGGTALQDVSGNVWPWGQLGFCLNYSLFQKSNSLMYLCRCTEVNYGLPCRWPTALTKALSLVAPVTRPGKATSVHISTPWCSPLFTHLDRVKGNVKQKHQ